MAIVDVWKIVVVLCVMAIGTGKTYGSSMIRSIQFLLTQLDASIEDQAPVITLWFIILLHCRRVATWLHWRVATLWRRRSITVLLRNCVLLMNAIDDGLCSGLNSVSISTTALNVDVNHLGDQPIVWVTPHLWKVVQDLSARY